MRFYRDLLGFLIMIGSICSCGGAESASTSTKASGALSGADNGQSGSIGGYTCEQQASWGKCSESWMHPACNNACGGDSSSQHPSINGYSCEQQASWGKCSESWMHPVCNNACGGENNNYWYLVNSAPSQGPVNLSTLPYPFDNNGLMVPNLDYPSIYSNNTGLIYNNVGGNSSFPYTNSSTTGEMGSGQGLVTPNFGGGYTYPPYWNGEF